MSKSELLKELIGAANEPCVWTEDEGGNWNTGCDNSFVIIEGSPAENKMRFCCYCGKPITEKPYVDTVSESES